MQGDGDCSGPVDTVDTLKLLRDLAALPVQYDEPCPDIGDEVASTFGDVDSVDARKVLRFVAALQYAQQTPCVAINKPL